MNKLTYAVFSALIGTLLFIIISANFISKVITGILTLALLFGTMIKMIALICFREMTGYARAEVSYDHQSLKYG